MRIKSSLLAVAAFVAMACAQSAAAGECRAQLRPLMLEADPDPRQLVAVRKLCTQEADAGEADALYQLALFDLGLLAWNTDVAIPRIQTAADQGVAEAQYWLAWQYDEGPLLPNDHQLALQWYEAAGQGDHPLALNRLATAYQEGDFGLAVDERKAATLRAKAQRCARDANS